MKPSIFNVAFLKADEVKTGDLIKFVDEGQEVESKKFTYPQLNQAGEAHPMAGLPKVQFQISIELGNGTSKTLSMNSTSFRQLATKWGSDTINWIGKLAKVELIPLPNGRKMISLQPMED